MTQAPLTDPAVGPISDPLQAVELGRASLFLQAVGLQFDLITATEVRAHLEVTEEHHTPWGITHGGLYATVIESVTSVGASFAVQDKGMFAVGVNNQTDFLRPHVRGRLDVVSTPIQQGRTLQLWSAELTNSAGKAIARGQVRLFNQALPDA
ncbi:uncharacterized protein (TIGR00369 family) [Jatrophihabitans sp. GAS493]|uniref:PaaI family thioesterase n=1 Tax=Jatrophihabitans sp. GAS493 TaxID=1907575 RepID=UPI000BB92FE7|nr:PaaI family thioesterase [Jatrophihabitans sp. GAS493]SOD70806.1 uncharacterized protein (TIGR00369 family) [Jatrophihabitans sp. GAS493]